MSGGEGVVQGTLKPDGMLELDQKPDLPPGRVTGILRPERVPSVGARGLEPLTPSVSSWCSSQLS
jgi:hypothetical protein